MKNYLKISVLALFLGAASPAVAGGLLTNTNQSATFARFMALDASTEVDAVYYNPAGLAMLNDGWHLYLTNQSAFQTRTLTTTLPTLKYNINNANNTSGSYTYTGQANAPLIPSFQLAWKKDKWVFSASFAVTGGGGKAEFDNGVPMFEAPLSVIPAGLTAKGLNTKNYSVDLLMNGTSIFYGGQLGATYKINDMFSVFAGARVVYAHNAYDGYIRNVMINPVYAGNPNGDMISAPDFANTMKTLYPRPNAFDTLAAGTTDKYVDLTQSGWGVTPILGANFNWNNLNVGVKYEFITKITVKNDTKVNDLSAAAPQFNDGVETPSDIPALLTVGASYRFLNKKLQVAAGYHHYFDKQAKMEGDKQNKIDHGINEYLIGIEWDAHKYFLVSAGAQYTDTGVSPAYQTDISQSFNSYSIGFGGAIKINEKMRVNLGYFFTIYEQMSKVTGNVTELYDRTNNVIAVGFDIKF